MSEQQTADEIVEVVARAIADSMGDNFDHAHLHKSQWVVERGDKGGRFRDINEPFQSDYLDAAIAAIASARPMIAAEERERCAKAIDGGFSGSEYAAAIRAMGVER